MCTSWACRVTSASVTFLDATKDYVSIVSLTDFRSCRQEQLPRIKALLDGLFCQNMLDAQEGDCSFTEEVLI